jgi:hypothetical protein
LLFAVVLGTFKRQAGDKKNRLNSEKNIKKMKIAPPQGVITPRQ